LDWHYKIGPITDHRAKFRAGRPTHLGDFASGEKIKNKTSGLKHKSFRKLSFSGGLIIYNTSYRVAGQKSLALSLNNTKTVKNHP